MIELGIKPKKTSDIWEYLKVELNIHNNEDLRIELKHRNSLEQYYNSDKVLKTGLKWFGIEKAYLKGGP